MKRVVIVLVLLIIAIAADARIGGGDSYSSDSSSDSSSSDSSSDYSSSGDSDYSSSSGGGGSSSGGGDVSGAVIAVMFLFFVGVSSVAQALGRAAHSNTTVISVAPTRAQPQSMQRLREFDPNFSEIVFTDFCYSLYARLYEALGRGQVDQLAPYVAAGVREGLKKSASAGLTGVDGIVIGSFTVAGFRGLDTPKVTADVEFESNYTEIVSGTSRRFYVRETWTLTRVRNLLSPAPQNAKAEHCPKCGAALETRTDGACLHCGTIVSDGTFNWFVTSIVVGKKDARPPQIAGGGGGIEPGLDRRTVIQPWIGRHCKTFVDNHPGFTWEDFYKRVHHVAAELQNAWSSRDWHRARPFETDALFQTHRYWIDEYLRQGLRNIVDNHHLDKIEIAKVASDAFYDAITVRLYASGNDYTVDESGSVVGGNPHLTKLWSEYWTFVRGRAGASADTRVCPNCGGALREGQTAVCEYCGGKVTTGEFPWVLSRIEQDESYRG